MIGIKHIAPFFAGDRVALQHLPDRQGLGAEQLSYYETMGIDSVFVASHYSAYDLACAAARKVLAESEVLAHLLDLIIFVRSRLPDTLISSEAARLQHDLGASKALSFSIGDLGCVDMSVALKLGVDYLKANPGASYVLLAHGCKPFSPHRFRYPVTVTGDGGLAVLLTRTAKNQVLEMRQEVDGKYWDLFKMEYLDKPFAEYQEQCTDLRTYGFELALHSKMRFREHLAALLASQRLPQDEVPHYLLQNISARAYEFYEEALGISISPVCAYNLARFGHLGPNDVLLNYYTGVSEGLFESGSKVVIMNNSPVAAWSFTLLQV
jgi:3-oxoacyl-[acyl-carrier-protein] synthase-3